jgi:Papain fold toxin 1, glutamine deamidase
VNIVELVAKYNHNHGEHGHFASGDGGGSSSSGGGLNPGSVTAEPTLRQRLEARAQKLGIEHPENMGGVELLEAIETAKQPPSTPNKPSARRAGSSRGSSELPFPKKVGGEYGAADLKAINPNFNKSPEYQNNCTRCATAVELRHRGYDVTANPNDGKGGGSIGDILSRWESSDGTPAGEGRGMTPAEPDETLGMSHGSRVFHTLPAGSGATNKGKINAGVKKWGNGSRGFVVVSWERRIDGSHIFNVENRGGKVVYSDGQNNSDAAGNYFSRVDTTRPGSVAVVRVDDLKPTAGLKDWVHAA